MCDKCNDTGILGVRNGDDDIPCECNEINTVATVEPLSDEAQLRLQLAKLDQAYEDGDKDSFRRYHEAMFDITVGLLFNLHMLLDLLDASRNESKRLAEEIIRLKDLYDIDEAY